MSKNKNNIPGDVFRNGRRLSWRIAYDLPSPALTPALLAVLSTVPDSEVRFVGKYSPRAVLLKLEDVGPAQV